MAEAPRDQNHVPSALGVSSVDDVTTLPFRIDPVTGRLLTDSSGGGGGVNIEEPATGVVDGSNLIFTFVNEPKAVSVDGLLRRDTKGYALTGSGPYTVTVDALSPPTYDIFSIY